MNENNTEKIRMHFTLTKTAIHIFCLKTEFRRPIKGILQKAGDILYLIKYNASGIFWAIE